MENFQGLGAGLAAIAFWGFIGMCVLGGIWDSIKKRETKHETLRRLVESGQPLDQNLLQNLDMLANSGAERFDRGLIITGIWLIPISLGMAVFAYVMGSVDAEAQTVLFGVAALLAVMGLGCIGGGKAISHWYDEPGGRPNGQQR